MNERAKVLRGLAACLPRTKEDAGIGCNGCPYNGRNCDDKTVSIPCALIEDIRALLKMDDRTEDDLK